MPKVVANSRNNNRSVGLTTPKARPAPDHQVLKLVPFEDRLDRRLRAHRPDANAPRDPKNALPTRGTSLDEK